MQTQRQRERETETEQNRATSGPPRKPLLYTSQPPRGSRRNRITQCLPPKPRGSRGIWGYRKMKRRKAEGWNMEKRENQTLRNGEKRPQQVGTACSHGKSELPLTPALLSSQSQNPKEMPARSSRAHRHTCVCMHWHEDTWIPQTQISLLQKVKSFLRAALQVGVECTAKHPVRSEYCPLSPPAAVTSQPVAREGLEDSWVTPAALATDTCTLLTQGSRTQQPPSLAHGKRDRV